MRRRLLYLAPGGVWRTPTHGRRIQRFPERLVACPHVPIALRSSADRTHLPGDPMRENPRSMLSVGELSRKVP